jgi:hypothetical protein
MTAAEAYFHILTNDIPDAAAGKMFGALCMKTPNGKAAAMFWKDDLVVKLDGDSWNEAMSLDGTKTFEPMDGRPMNGWIQIPYHYKDQWEKFTRVAVESVKKLEKKEPKKKK